MRIALREALAIPLTMMKLRQPLFLEVRPPDPQRKYIYCIDWGKSLLTGDKSVIAIIDVTDPESIAVVQYHSFQSPYTYVTKKAIELALKLGPRPYAIFLT